MNLKTFFTHATLLCVLALGAFAQDASMASTLIDVLRAMNEDAPAQPANFTRVTGTTKTGTAARAAMYTTGETPPTLTDFYWGNPGACVANANPSGTFTMFHPGAAGLGFNWCVLVKPLPAAPYTIVTRTQGHIFGKAASMGLVLYDMNTQKFIVYSMPGASDSGAAAVAAWRMNTFTSYLGSPAGIVFNYTSPMATGGLQAGTFVRLKDNGTTRTVAIAADKGGPWLTISATANTDHSAGNWFGYALRGTGDNMASMMTMYHEEITTP